MLHFATGMGHEREEAGLGQRGRMCLFNWLLLRVAEVLQ